MFGDARERLKEIQSNFVSLTVTSPPYWYLERFTTEKEDVFKGDLSRIKDRRTFFVELGKVWKQVYRVTKNGGYLAVEWEDIPIGSKIYGYPREICICGDMVESVESAGFYLVGRWIWKKFEAGASLEKFQYVLYSNLSRNIPRPCSNWAYVFVFRKMGVEKTRILDFTKDEWKEWADGVWRIENPSVDAHGIEGGAVFPVELVKRLIKIYTRPYQVVLDPFLGTGTTMKAAFLTNRSCIGVEVNLKMRDIIKRKVGWNQSAIDGGEIVWEEK